MPSRLSIRISVIALALVGAIAAACATRFPDRVPNGQWGGPHAGMVVSDTGAAIEYDCGAGRISGALMLDAHGNFDLPGLYIREGPGPVPANDSLVPKLPARYTGRTDGHTMTLTMTVLDGSIPQQSFDLVFGGNPNVFKCV